MNSTKSKQSEQRRIAGPKNFSYSFQPLFDISRVFCVFPFSLRSNPNGEIIGTHIYSLNFCSMLLFILSNIAFTIYGAHWLILIQGNTSSKAIGQVGNTLLLALKQVSIVSFLVTVVYHRERFIKILQHFDKFDREISDYGIFIDHQRIRKTAIICYKGAITFACIRTLAVMSVVIFDPRTRRESFETIIMSAIFTSTWAVVLYILGELTYLMMVFGASNRLEQIRFCLRQRFQLRKGPIVQHIEINSEDLIAFVKRMGKLYENVCEIVDDINGVFSIHMMLLIGRSFVAAIFTFYVVDAFIVAPDAMSTYMVSFHVSIFCYIGVLSSIIFYGGNQVPFESKQISTEIHEIMNNYQEGLAIKSLVHLSQQIKLRQPKVTCELFEIDWSLLFTIIGATTSYLIILLQFAHRQSEKNKNNGHYG